ncbi:MAG: hypothetical protein EZS28_017839 [Streblomastix strix]|uniref:Uncharacterized protein n=1 Tax=Streblomastix strix TaxID=222440 RepID=A0A5J4VVN9_9EUKA|nr:MAG: hypothetical protein EZS28_017839 [Streblomastix strix]
MLILVAMIEIQLPTHSAVMTTSEFVRHYSPLEVNTDIEGITNDKQGPLVVDRLYSMVIGLEYKPYQKN